MTPHAGSARKARVHGRNRRSSPCFIDPATPLVSSRQSARAHSIDRI